LHGIDRDRLLIVPLKIVTRPDRLANPCPGW